MGKIKDLAEQNKSVPNVQNPANISARIAGEAAERLKNTLDGQSLSTSTQTDNDNSQSSNHITQEAFNRAEQAKQERLRVKQQIEEYNSDNTQDAQHTNKTHNKELNESEKLNQNKKETEFRTELEKKEESFAKESQKAEELQEDLDYAQSKKAIREKSIAQEQEQEKQQEQEQDKFNQRDKSIKESSNVQDKYENLDKLNNDNTRLNEQNSLKKIRGGEEEAISEGAKKETAKKTTSSVSSKAASGLTAITMIKAAGSALFVDTDKKRSNEATESSGMLILIIAAAALLVISPLILIMIPIMGGAGGRQAYDETTSQSSSVTQEELTLWNILMEHFDDNETAVLGIMCNVYYESGFMPNNLEGTNNFRWNISDEEYTAQVNDGTVSKTDFCQSRYNGSTTGYGGQYGWTNCDGGYGYCQFTAYDKKERLYNFATDYFDFGIGEGQTFDISNAEMQSYYICDLLDNEYNNIDTMLKEATSIEDAVYIWCRYYEIPDPTATIKADGTPCTTYEEVAEVRAGMATTIQTECELGVVGGGSGTEVTEEELNADHIHYNQYDPRWGDLPYYYSGSSGSNTITKSGCGPTCLAMAVTELTRNTSNPIVLTPDAACDYSASHGCHVSSGTSHALFTNNSLLEPYGLNGVELEKNEATFKEYLDSGCLLVITVGTGTYTQNGHFMIICEYDDTGFLINDPNYNASKPYRVSYSYLTTPGQGSLEHVFAVWTIY